MGQWANGAMNGQESASAMSNQAILRDSHGRAIRDLRISVTDRCNFRCFYCMPKEAMEWRPKAEILTYEEILELTSIFVSLGIDKLRVTGGEPMLRRDLEELIAKLAQISGVSDLAMTTNAHFLAGRAEGVEGSRIAADHDQPRLTDAGAIRATDRADRVATGAGRDRRGDRRRTLTGQGQLCRHPRHQR